MKFKFAHAIVVVLLLAGTHEATAAVVEVSILPYSQANSAPSIADVWDATVHNGVFSFVGIGIIIDPSYVSANDQADFALHQNFYLGSPYNYDAPFVPHAATSTVLFKFDQPTIVSGVEIVQHLNGVDGVSGLAGDSLSSLDSIGSADISVSHGYCNDSALYDGEISTFNFGNYTKSGTLFSITVTSSVCSFAFALHRIFPLDQNGNIIMGLDQTTPELSTWAMMLLGFGGLGLAAARRARALATAK